MIFAVAFDLRTCLKFGVETVLYSLCVVCFTDSSTFRSIAISLVGML